MSIFFIPSQGPDSWKYSLVDREKQWKEGYSAYELAHCWEYAKELPECVRTVFEDSGIPLFQNVEILFGFPEYKVSLPGGSTSSQNDLYVLAKANNELLTIMIEGKVSEPFGETVQVCLGKSPSKGKCERLEYLLNLLNLKESDVMNMRYQLLHRTASALKEAERVGAKNALMLVQSFSEKDKWFEDYAKFVELFSLSPSVNSIEGPVVINGVNLYFGWVKCPKQKD